ncbi:MAG: hypothetical protein ACFFGZ_16940 [Candidatus Thorarchaeota archaeon]
MSRQDNVRFAYFVLMLALSGIFILSSLACSTGKSEMMMPPMEEIEAYIRTADHLNEQQKKDLLGRKPFVGMTIDEANLSMRKESTDLVMSGTTLRAVYVGGSGVRYYLYFQGDPLRLAEWSYLSEDEIKLTDPDQLRPRPPGIR